MLIAPPCRPSSVAWSLLAALVLSSLAATTAEAQIVAAPRTSAGTRVPTLQETLVNNLRATTVGQRDFLRRVDEATVEHRLSPQLVLAVMRYAQRRHAAYPFPYFERALRYEASKRGVYLPAVAIVASSAMPRFR